MKDNLVSAQNILQGAWIKNVSGYYFCSLGKMEISFGPRANQATDAPSVRAQRFEQMTAYEACSSGDQRFWFILHYFGNISEKGQS